MILQLSRRILQNAKIYWSSSVTVHQIFCTQGMSGYRASSAGKYNSFHGRHPIDDKRSYEARKQKSSYDTLNYERSERNAEKTRKRKHDDIDGERRKRSYDFSDFSDSERFRDSKFKKRHNVYDEFSQSFSTHTRYEATYGRDEYHRDSFKKHSRDKINDVTYGREKYYRDNGKHSQERDSASRKPSSSSKRSLSEEIDNILNIEVHHIINIHRGKDGSVEDVRWCPKYLKLSKSLRRAPGGRALLHHRCRSCGRICLHLLGKYGSSDRKCLACSAESYSWDPRKVPKWYFHDRKCDNCRY